jgi:XTP/dITP diphosphohydrolase
MEKLLIATNNRGKLMELGRMIASLEVELVTLGDIGVSEIIEETADTFLGNANLKAAGYAKIGKLPTLADDSGLSVDYLGGRPGVLSARYAGENRQDADRVQKVLEEMRRASPSERSAHFTCAISLANAGGDVVASVEGICEGTIADGPRGEMGFGYDPIFFPSGYHKTFAELDAEAKDRISHRANAIVKIIPFLQGFFER